MTVATATQIIEDYEERKETAQMRADEINNVCLDEGRDPTEDEETELDGLAASIEMFDKRIARQRRLQGTGEAPNPGRKTAPTAINTAPAAGGSPRRRSLPAQPKDERREARAGFSNFGDFALSVRSACARGGHLDDRLKAMMADPTTFANEGTNADGGFLVPPDFRNEIIKTVQAEDSLRARTSQFTSESNNVILPLDEATPWGSTGIQATWGAEGAEKGQSKPVLGQHTTTLHKLFVLAPVTDELLEDQTLLDSWLRGKAPEMINHKIDHAIMAGDGSDRPLGINDATSAATVVVAKETGQAADTIVAENIEKMWARLYSGCRANAVWIVHQTVEPELQKLVHTINDSTPEPVGGWPLYLPPGGLSAAPFATLKGRPVITTQAAELLGDKGDITLTDLSKYMTITKSSGIQVDVSMHLWFDFDQTAYRFVMRVGGRPMWTQAIAQRVGADTLGSSVTLAERA